MPKARTASLRPEKVTRFWQSSDTVDFDEWKKKMPRLIKEYIPPTIPYPLTWNCDPDEITTKVYKPQDVSTNAASMPRTFG